ncbi:MAG: cytochrome c3 family protein [Planctomycetota bacterium]
MKIFDQKSLSRCLAILSLALIVALSCLAFSENDETESDCVSCHEDVYNDGLSNFYMHAPFEKKQCGMCHLKQDTVSRVSDSISKEIVHPVVLSQTEYLTEHTILLKGLIPRAVYDINVIFQDMSGDKVRQGFEGVVPENIQNVKTDDKRPPSISEVEVGPVVKRIFLEATITWQTDEPSSSWVEYGFSDQYGQRTPEDSTLVKYHEVNVYELEGGKDCHFRVRSQDIFGNESVSEDMVFNTGKILSPSDIEEKGAGTEDYGTLAVSRAEAFLIEPDLGLYLETTKPACVTVEYVKVEELPAEESLPVQAAATSEDDHVELRDGKGLAIDACYKCHPPEDLGVSHPVGIGPKEKTKIPDDLPTLEGGIITCVTCHDAHGGSRRYFAWKKITKDICISCHEGY